MKADFCGVIDCHSLLSLQSSIYERWYLQYSFPAHQLPFLSPELVTAPLTRGDILPGVTRASILDLARSWGEFDVSERYITMGEIREAANENRLLEAFGAGTAAVVTPVSCIQYKGEDIDIPAVGELTQRVWDEITGIQYRTKEAPPGWIVEL